jgi:hypothetical protein
MASNETIQNLATLLGALRDFNQPRREIESYAKKAMIDFNMQKKLLDLELERTKEDEEVLGLAMAAERARSQEFGMIPTTEDVEEEIEMLEEGAKDKLGLSSILSASLAGPGLQGTLAAQRESRKSKQQQTLMDAVDLLETNVYKGTLDPETGIPTISGTFTEAAQLAKGQMKTDLLSEAAEYKSQIKRILDSSEFRGESLLDEATRNRLITTEDLLNQSINILRK